MYPDPGHLLRLQEVVSLLQDCRQHCMCLQDGTERRALLDLIDARRRLGVAGTGAGMLVPAKSLLYVQGLRPPGAGQADAPDPAPPCKTCARRDCPFRREKNNDESEEERC